MKRPDRADFMPLHATWWLTSSSVTAWPDRVKVAYITLLCRAWLDEPRGTLPDDDDLLQKLSGQAWTDWHTWKPVLFKSWRVENGRLVHPQLFGKADCVWRTPKPRVQSPPAPIALTGPGITERMRRAYQDWIVYRQEMKLPVTPTAAKLDSYRLSRLGEERALIAISESINRKYRGIYECKPRDSKAVQHRT